MRKRKQCVMRYHKPSKFSLPENYYMVLLQLYMPWRHEDEIIGHFGSYEDKFNHVYDEIEENILHHEPFFGQFDINEMDLEDNPHFMDTMESSDDDTAEIDDERNLDTKSMNLLQKNNELIIQNLKRLIYHNHTLIKIQCIIFNIREMFCWISYACQWLTTSMKAQK